MYIGRTSDNRIKVVDVRRERRHQAVPGLRALGQRRVQQGAGGGAVVRTLYYSDQYRLTVQQIHTGACYRGIYRYKNTF